MDSYRCCDHWVYWEHYFISDDILFFLDPYKVCDDKLHYNRKS